MKCKKLAAIDMLAELTDFYHTYLLEDKNDLHIILEDGNIENKDINFCMVESFKNNNYVAVEICQLLRLFTPSCRKHLLENNFNNYPL